MEPKWMLSLGETTTYGAETIAKFTSESQIYERPSIVSATAGGNFNAIAVDNLLIAIHEQDVCSINFKSTIDDIAILPGGYIAVGERNGILTIGILEGDNQFKVKLSYLLIPDAKGTTEAAFVRVLFQITEEFKTEYRARIICLSSQGLLMTFCDIILKNGDIDLASVKQGKLATPHIRALNLVTTQDHIITVGAGPHCVAVYGLVNEQAVLEDTASLDCDELTEMVKIQMLPSANVFVTLDSKGKFYVWDMYTMTVVHTWMIADVSDFNLIQLKTNQSFSFRLGDLKLVVVQQGKVQALSLPSLAVSSEYCCGSNFAVLSHSSCTQDEVYVAECSRVEDEDEAETTVYFRCYTETSPQKRLLRLIAKKRYEEAEKFAKLFGLPFNLGPEIVQSKMREVKETFAETAMHINQCKEQLLKNKSGDSTVAVVLAELQEMEHRLESYVIVYGEENFCPMEWETFQYENPLTLCCKLLMIDAEKSFKLWACFQEELQNRFKPGLLQQMLQRIPSSVPCQMVADWLRKAVIPFIITSDPEAVTNIIQWIEEQVGGLETSGKGTWLDDAIQVCKSMLESLELAVVCDVDDVSDDNLQDVKTKMNCALALSPLKTLVKSLHGLKELKMKYKCHLTLETFRKETKHSIAYRMLDDVPDVQLLPATLNEKVLPYLKNSAIDPDEVFAKYMQDLLERSDASHHQYVWEDKVKALINIIGDPKAKITAVLNLLDNVMLPLPDFIEGVVIEVISTVQHPQVTTLKEKWNIKETDNILSLYGLNPKEVNSRYAARMAAKYVVASGGTVNEAQKILMAHKISEDDVELPKFQCRLFIERSEIDKLAHYLKLLPQKTARKCCSFIIYNAKHFMADENNHIAQMMRSIRFDYYEAALVAASYFKTLTNDWLEGERDEETVQTVKNSWHLEVFYKILVNSDCLKDKIRCKTIFSNHIQTSRSTTLIGLGNLLNLTDGEIIEVILSKLSEESDSSILKLLLQKLAVLYGTCGSMPPALVNNVLSAVDIKDVSLSYVKLAQLYMAHCCNGDKISTTYEVCRQVDLLSVMFLQDQDNISLQAHDILDVDYFQEGSASKASRKILSGMTEAVFAVTGDDLPLEDVLVQLEVVIGNLWKAEQHQLAMQVLLLISSRLHSVAIFLPTEEKQYFMGMLEKIMSMARNTSMNLIVKILNAVPMDGLLAVGHILMLSKEQSVPQLQKIVRSCWNNYPKLKRVNTVVSAVAEILEDQKLIDSSQRIKVIAKWGNRLSKIGIPFKSDFLSNISEAMEAVKKLVQSPHCDVNILNEFFRDFNLEACQLNSVLMQFFEVCLTVHSEDKLSPAMLKKAEDALWCFESNSLNVLKKVLKETHPYNYEVLQFLLEQIQKREESKETSKGLELLRYLHLYKRYSPPCPAEKKKFGSIIDENGDLGHNLLPDAASNRLPFHLLHCKDNIWEVISAEINSQTLGLWLEMAPVLSISRDNLLLKASTNMTENYIKSSTTSSNNSVSQEFRRVLAHVDTILSQLEEKEKAMWWCHSTFNKLTHVGEKTIALQGCVLHAKKWLNSAQELHQKEKAKKSVDMFFRKLQLHSTLWALCQAGLDKERELTKLIKEPVDLIQQLYTLPCVIESNEEQRDINKLCDEIADLHGTNILDLRKILLDKWLLGTSLGDADQTLTFDVFPQELSMQDELERALYLMKSRDRLDLLHHVASIANLVDGSVSTATHKKALYCVLKIGTAQEIADLLKKGNN